MSRARGWGMEVVVGEGDCGWGRGVEGWYEMKVGGLAGTYNFCIYFYMFIVVIIWCFVVIVFCNILCWGLAQM